MLLLIVFYGIFRAQFHCKTFLQHTLLDLRLRTYSCVPLAFSAALIPISAAVWRHLFIYPFDADYSNEYSFISNGSLVSNLTKYFRFVPK